MFRVSLWRVRTRPEGHQPRGSSLGIFYVGMHGGRTAIPGTYAGITMDQSGDDGGNYDSFIELVKQMWQENQEDRPGFDIIVKKLDDLFQI